MTRWTPDKLRKRTSRAMLEMANIVRRVILTATAGGQWQTEGYELDGTVEGEDDIGEAEEVDNFQGIHIYARPASGDNSEAILLHVGGKTDHPVIGATRNEDARLRYVEEFGDLAAGETAVFNSTGTARIVIQADGSVEITVPSSKKLLVRTNGGTTDALVTKTEHNGHIHSTSMGPTAVPTTPATGTVTLEVE